MISNNNDDIIRLRNHNKILVTKNENLKNIWKFEQDNEDIEGKLLEKEEENCHLRNHNQNLMERIKKWNDDEKSQEETFKKINNDKMLLEKNR